MAVQIPPGYALAAWEMRFPGDPDPWYCTCGVDISDHAGTATQMANDLFDAWATNILPTQHVELSLAGVTLKIGSDGAPTMAYSTAGAELGTSNVNMLPQNCALLVDKLSATGGRRGRGRFYVPAALSESGVSNIGVISEGNVTGAQTLWDSFHANFASDALVPVILHSPSAPDVVNPSDLIDPTPITSFRVQSVISTQRDRLR